MNHLEAGREPTYLSKSSPLFPIALPLDKSKAIGLWCSAGNIGILRLAFRARVKRGVELWN